MRRVLAIAVSALCLLTAMSAIGCGDSNKKAKIPDKLIDTPKEGPVPAGGGAPKQNATND
jgi:hypothetical protein